jgi:twinkle protein
MMRACVSYALRSSHPLHRRPTRRSDHRCLHAIAASSDNMHNGRMVFSHQCVPTRDTQIRTKVFVSKYNTSINVNPQEIKDVFLGYGIALGDLRQAGQHILVRDCPFCHPIRGKPDNQFKLNVKIGDGCYQCFRCGEKGNWYDLKMKLGGYEVVTSSGGSASMGSGGRDTPGNTNYGQTAVVKLPMPDREVQIGYMRRLFDRTKTPGSQVPAMNPALTYLLDVRKLDEKTLIKYGVGCRSYTFDGAPHDCVSFPWMVKASMIEHHDDPKVVTSSKSTVRGERKGNTGNEDAKNYTEREPFILRRIKVRSLENKALQRLDPPGGGWGFFGYQTIPDNATEVVVTEGEYDAMAVYQATGMPAISLPTGCRNLPIELLPLLERFEKVYLWMDSDGPGQEGAETFAPKIGLKRCHLVQPQTENGEPAPKDANEALIRGMNLKAILDRAAPLRHEFVLNFKDFRSQVLNEIFNPEKYTGVAIKSLPSFTKLIKGFRRGEVTVLAEAGVNTLWGSFEIKNTRLIHKLFQQFGRMPLPTAEDKLRREKVEALADQFETLPMYFLKFHGGSDIDRVLDAMEYAVYVHDVEHIILDNMQFMITRKPDAKSFDKFDVQDIAIEKFRKFATAKNVHLTLVVHPKKVDDKERLGMSDFYGSAKATQEADTVLILQSDGVKKFIEVKKNRFDGTIGSAPLYFNSDSGRYTDTEQIGKTEGRSDNVYSQFD